MPKQAVIQAALLVAIVSLAGCSNVILNARFNGETGPAPKVHPNGAPAGDRVEMLDVGPEIPIVGNNVAGAAGITPPSLFMAPRVNAASYAVRFITTDDYDSSKKRTISWQGRWYGSDRMECRVGGFFGSQFRYGPTVRFASGNAQTFDDGTWHNIAPITAGETHTVRMRYYPDNTYYVTVQQAGVAEGRYPTAGTIAASSWSQPAIEQTEKLILHCVFLDEKIAGEAFYRYVIDTIRIQQSNS